MKVFTDIREKKSPGDIVVDSGKIKRIRYEIRKDKKNQFHAHIDGDYLDKFRSQKDAKKAIDMAIKELA